MTLKSLSVRNRTHFLFSPNKEDTRGVTVEGFSLSESSLAHVGKEREKQNKNTCLSATSETLSMAREYERKEQTERHFALPHPFHGAAAIQLRV